jgi:large repetitive protein
VILAVDASNPNSLVTSTLDVSSTANCMSVVGSQVYVASASGLQIYQSGGLFNLAVTAEVDVPNNGAAVVANSFSTAPTEIVNGANSEALIWDLTLTPGESEQITWQSTVSDLLTGQIEMVASDATFQYVTAGMSEELTLPAVQLAGLPNSQSVVIPVSVVVPGVPALAAAATAADQIGNTNLGDQLNDLSTALTNLVQNPTSAVYLSQAEASLTSIVTQLTNDPFLSSFVSGLNPAESALAGATSAGEIDTAVINLGSVLNSLAQTIADEAAYGFTISLGDDLAVIQPGVPAVYEIVLDNTGSDTATYDFSVSGLPAGVTATFSQPSVTLAPGQSIPNTSTVVTLSLSESGDTLVAADFVVTATAEEAPEITLGTSGQLTLRTESLQVADVATNTPFTQPGGSVDVTTEVESVVNEPREVSISYTVTDANGDVLFTSTPVPESLSIRSTFTSVDLGSFDTTGYSDGLDTITVTITDQSSSPLPTATGQGTVTIGLPVTATLSVTPDALPSGSGTVTNTLAINATIILPDPLTVDGSVATTPTASTIALFQNGTQELAYVGGTNGVDIVDVTNPALPVDDGTFAGSLIVKGGFTCTRVDTIAGSPYLLIGTTAGLNANQFGLLLYSLANPLAPSLVSNTAIPYNFLDDMLVSGNTLLVPTDGVSLLLDKFVTDQFGSLISIDLSNPAAPTVAEVLYNGRGAPQGGDTSQTGGVLVNSQLAYIGSSTSEGSVPNSGVGRVLLVNYSDPSNLTVLGEVDVPGTVHILDVAIQGNDALLVGCTGGISANGFTGNLTLSVMDITNPESPQLVGTTLITQSTFNISSSVSALALGNGLFAVSSSQVNGTPVLLLVDPTNPANIAVTYTSVPGQVFEMAVSGDILYAPNTTGLTTYNIGQLVDIPLTVSVDVPNGTNVTSGSYNIAPSQIIQGTSFNTLVWNTTLAYPTTDVTFTWQSTIGVIGADQVLPVTLGTTIDFTSDGVSGTVNLPAGDVTGVPIISLIPTSQTAQPGATADYDVRLTNPTATQVTYVVSEKDSNGTFSLVTIDQVNNQQSSAQVTVGPGATVDVPLAITTDADAATGSDPFTITAGDSSTGASGTAQGMLTLAGSPFLPTVSNPNAYGVVASISPAEQTAGPGTSANYVLQITNTGSTNEDFVPQVNGLPKGVSATFGETSVSVPPGVNNFRDVTLTLNVAASTPADLYSFSVAIAATDGMSSTTVNGTLNVVANGVSVALNPPSGAPGKTFEMTVTNTGTVQDTFDLSLGGPGALVASLATDKVTLAAGASQNVQITTGTVNFADSGNLALTAIAVSETNAAVTSSATSELVIPTTMGMTSSFSPATQLLPIPGTASFLLLVNNTGNLQDSYTATITGTTGPVTANLVDLDGSPTQTIPIFILPGLSTGAIVLQTDLTSAAEGTVTVQVTSLSNDAITSSATATVNTSELTVPTVTATDAGGTYDGNPFPATATATGIGGASVSGSFAFTYYVGTGTGGAGSSTAPTAAGNYTVVAAFTSTNSNYVTGPTDSLQVTFTIGQATPSVVATDAGGTYNGNSYPASATATGVGDATVSGSFVFTYYVGTGTGGASSSTSPSAAGNYTVVAAFTSTNPNYVTSPTDSLAVTFTIGQATPTVTATDAGGPANGSSYPASAAATGVGGATVSGSFTFTYYVGSTATGSGSSTAPSAAGTYIVVAAFTSTNSNYVTGPTDSAPVTFTITSAAPAVQLGLLLLDPSGSRALDDTGGGAITVNCGGAIVVDSDSSTAAIVTGNGSVNASQIDVTGGTEVTGRGKF